MGRSTAHGKFVHLLALARALRTRLPLLSTVSGCDLVHVGLVFLVSFFTVRPPHWQLHRSAGTDETGDVAGFSAMGMIDQLRATAHPGRRCHNGSHQKRQATLSRVPPVDHHRSEGLPEALRYIQLKTATLGPDG